MKTLNQNEVECVSGGVAVTVATIATIATSVATGVIGFLILNQGAILKATFTSIEETIKFISKIAKKKNRNVTAVPEPIELEDVVLKDG